jgi:tetratricopeptide (TPR) repeat protein
VAELVSTAPTDRVLAPFEGRGRPAALYRIPLSLMMFGLLLIAMQAGKPLLGLAVMLTALMSTAALAWRTVARRVTPVAALRDEGDALLVGGEYQRARVLYERALAIAQRELPPASPEVLINYYSLAAVNSMLHDHQRADRYLEQLLQGLDNQIPNPWSGHVAWLMRRVAHHHSLHGDHDRAIALCRRSLDLVGDAPGADDNTVRSLVDDLAWIHHHAGDYPRAESLFREALGIHERFRDVALELAQRSSRQAPVADSPYRVPGPPAVSTTGGLDRAVAYSQLGLGWTLYERGQYEAAARCFDRAAVVCSTAGLDHAPSTDAKVRTLTGLRIEIFRGQAAVHVTLGQWALASAAYADAKALCGDGVEPQQVAALMLDVGWLARCREQYSEAEAAYNDALARVAETDEGTAALACALHEGMAELRRREGRLREGIKHAREAQTLGDQYLGREHPRMAGILAVTARLQVARGEHTEAERLARGCLALLRTRFGAEHPRIADGFLALGELQLARGSLGAAEQSFERALAKRTASLGDDHPELLEVLDGLAAVFRTLSRDDEAEVIATRMAEIRTRAGLDPT